MNDRQLRTSLIKIAHKHPESRAQILQVLKKAHGPVVIKNPDVMLYAIDKAKNQSKFYEMQVVQARQAPRAQKDDKKNPDGDWCVVRRWGRLTDKGGLTGTPASMNSYFYSQREAEAWMKKFAQSKERGSSKYTDVSRSREYPIGLGGAAFWGDGQAACQVQPELRNLLQQMSKAQEDLNAGLKMITPISRQDSSMAKKLQGQMNKALSEVASITKYLGDQLSAC
jgi:predicted DNA-binding WGR domain protein